MGGGTWTTSAYATYSVSRGRSVDDSGRVTTSYASAQDMYTQRGISERMDPRKFTVRERECRDSAEHPNTLPVILGIDVTGSMGSAAMEVAKSLNGIVTDIGKKCHDAEFCVMAIGDTHFDEAPVQMSQFESDVRIARSFDDIWFEGGGGSNDWESYTAAWYMAAFRTDLDIWKRGGKGVIITLGDEPINEDLDLDELSRFVSDPVQGEETLVGRMGAKCLYDYVRAKYDVYHICVSHGGREGRWIDEARKSFADVIGGDNVYTCRVEDLGQIVPSIVLRHASEMPSGTEQGAAAVKVDENGDIDWDTGW